MSLWEAFYGRRIRQFAGLAAAGAAVAALAVADLTSSRGNYSPAYLLLLIAIAPLAGRKVLVGTMFALVALTYAGHFSRMSHVEPADYIRSRLVNRTFVAFVLMATTLLLVAIKPGFLSAASLDAVPARPRGVPLLRRLESFRWTVAVWLFLEAACILADCLAPAHYNWAMLHLLPVAIAAQSRSRTFLWIAVFVALLATRAGLSLGPYPPDPDIMPTLYTNRLMVRFGIIGIALLLDPSIGDRFSQKRKSGLAGSDHPAPHLAYIAPPRPAGLRPRRRTRVLFIDHTARLGGGEIALLNLVTTLDLTRFEPTVLLGENGPLVEKLRERGVTTRVIALDRRVVETRKESLNRNALWRVRDVACALRDVAKLTRFIRRGRYDIVHTNSLKSDVLGGLAGRLAGRRVVWHVRDRVDPDYLPSPAVHALRGICCALADYVITNSHATMGLLRPTFGDVFGERAARERMCVVHDGVPPDAFDVPVSRERNGTPVIGLLGRISPFKGQDDFIHAARRVREHFPQSRFRIIGAALFGEAAYEARVRSLVQELRLEDAVEFCGFRSDVGTAIAELDVMAHASITGEPFGLVIAEGMAAGKPVVATDGGGVPEIIEAGISGLLVPPRSPDALAHAICQLLSNPAQAQLMGARGRERIRRYFTVDNTTRKVEHFYDVIRRRSRYGPASVDDTAGKTASGKASNGTRARWLLWPAVFTEVVYAIIEASRAAL